MCKNAYSPSSSQPLESKREGGGRAGPNIQAWVTEKVKVPLTETERASARDRGSLTSERQGAEEEEAFLFSPSFKSDGGKRSY